MNETAKHRTEEKKSGQKPCGKIVERKKKDTTLAYTDGHTLNEKELIIYIVINGQFE